MCLENIDSLGPEPNAPVSFANLSKMARLGQQRVNFLSVEPPDKISEYLHSVLRTQGPAALSAFVDLPRLPMLTFQDANRSADVTVVEIEGEELASFEIGGEPRVCFPQLMATCLLSHDISEINKTMSRLNIYRSPCTSEQTAALRKCGAVQPSTAACDLLTLTDCYRICMELQKNRRPNAPLAPAMSNLPGDLCVEHECFGRACGILRPSLYSSTDSRCVTCVECRELLTPRSFVLHSHGPSEVRTVHWGFNPENWRAYIHLPSDGECSEEATTSLEAVKDKFKDCRAEHAPTPPAISPRQPCKRKIPQVSEAPKTFSTFSALHNIAQV